MLACLGGKRHGRDVHMPALLQLARPEALRIGSVNTPSPRLPFCYRRSEFVGDTLAPHERLPDALTTRSLTLHERRHSTAFSLWLSQGCRKMVGCLAGTSAKSLIDWLPGKDLNLRPGD